MADTKQLIVELSLENAKLKKGLNDTKKRVKGLGSDAKDSSGKFQAAWLKAVAGVVGALVAAKKVFDFGKEFAEFEQSTNAMSRQFGKDADLVIAKLKEVSAGTISNKDLVLAANRTMALNVTKDVGQMAKLLEIARFRARAMGITTTQAFNDITTGIGRQSPLILDNLGIITKGWNEEAKAAGVAFDTQFVLNKVLKQGSEELEKAGPLALTNAERFQKLSTAFSNLTLLLGEQLIPILIPVVNKVTEIVEAFSKLPPSIKTMIGSLAAGTPIIIGAAAAFGPLGAGIAIVGTLAATAVVEVDGLLKALKQVEDAKAFQKQQEELLRNQKYAIIFEKRLKELNKQFKKGNVSAELFKKRQASLNKAIDRHRGAIDKVFRANKRATKAIEDQEKQSKKLLNIFKDFKLPKLKPIKFAPTDEEAKDDQKKILAQREALTKAVAAQDIKLRGELVDQSEEAILRQVIKEKELVFKAEEEKAITAEEANQQLLLIEAAHQERMNELRREGLQEGLKLAGQYATQVGDIGQGIVDFQKNLLAHETQNRIDAVEQETLTEEEKAAKIETIKRDSARKEAEIERNLFFVNKAASLAQVGIDTAKAIIGFLANPGGIAGVGLSVGAGITGGLQAANIASAPPPSLPTFAEGGTSPGGSILVGERGPEILEPPAGSTITKTEDIRVPAPAVNIYVNSNDGQAAVRTINNYMRQYGNSQRGALV